MKQELPRPTDAELEILNVLWDQGPATVRQVNDHINRTKSVGYTTTLKLMQRMTDKGLLTPDQSERSYVYSANLSRERAQRRMVRDVLRDVMGGSAHRLILHALDAQPMSDEELARIEEIIRQKKGGEP